jgi:SPP1 gp7 family putative phage head morphogenesis protein
MAVRTRQPEGSPIEVNPAHEARLSALNRAIVSELAAYSEQVLRMYPSLLAETRMDAKRRISLRPVTAMVNGFRVQYAREFDRKEPAITRFLNGLSDEMIAHNKRLWKANLIDKAVEAGLSADAQAFAIAQEPDIPQAVSTQWTNTQLSLVKKLGTSRVPSIPFEHFQRLEVLVQNSVYSGLRVEELRKELAELDGVSTRRAEVIARDQAGKYNGKMTEIRHESIGVKAYYWRTTGDGRVRDEHRARDGKRFLYSRPPADGAPGIPVQCFPGDTRVDLIDGIGVYRRHWSGSIAWANIGNIRLRATPNHPILTIRGWIGLGELKQGDYVVSAMTDITCPTDAEQRQSSFRELYSSLSLNDSTRSRFSGEFHGDISDDNVDYISSDGNLTFDFISGKFERPGKIGLPYPPDGVPLMGSPSHLIIAALRAAYGCVSGLDLLHSGGTSHLAPFDQLGFALVPRLHAHPQEPMTNDPTIHAEFIRKLKLALASKVLRLDPVLSVGRELYSGFVYNASTRHGIYLAQGIVAHNCRCWADPDFDAVFKSFERKSRAA